MFPEASGSMRGSTASANTKSAAITGSSSSGEAKGPPVKQFPAQKVAVEAVSDAASSSSSSSSSSVSYPQPTTTSAASETENSSSVGATQAPKPSTATGSSSSSMTEDSTTSLTSEAVSTSASDANETPVSSASATESTVARTDAASSSSDSVVTEDSQTRTSTSVSEASSKTDTAADDGEASIASATSDSSTFQLVESEECDDSVVDSVYTLYANCRSAFDLCVSASDYQVFPYLGEHPTQAQVQAMAESDACAAVFIVVVEANLSACTVGGMPLVSATETLLKIRVDLQEGVEDSGPSADEFQELLAWRYAVDRAKAADVPYDGDSELYAQFETNLEVALANTTIRVNEDLTVDIQLANGSYESFEDALYLVVADASEADMAPGYVKASSGKATASSASSSSSSSQSLTGVVSESSRAPSSLEPTAWNLFVAVAVSALVLVEGTAWRT
ncbi:hypothetical protein BBJ28_00007576 [Nothophytophthora sp. Chile5]|nr:hypothetical protein BBJ28_00007576 [Nothophytophthora sp. Chile5]